LTLSVALSVTVEMHAAPAVVTAAATVAAGMGGAAEVIAGGVMGVTVVSVTWEICVMG
jgi:hypothetical protein